MAASNSFSTVIPAGKAKAKPLRDFDAVNGTSMTWTVDFKYGSNIGLKIVDAWGMMNWSGALEVQNSTDSSCVVPDPPSTGMPVAVKAGIGAGVGGGVLALVGLFFLFWFCRRRRAAKAQAAKVQAKEEAIIGTDTNESSPTKSAKSSKSTTDTSSDEGPHLPSINYRPPTGSIKHIVPSPTAPGPSLAGATAPQRSASASSASKVTYPATSARPVTPSYGVSYETHKRALSDVTSESDSGSVKGKQGFVMLSDDDHPGSSAEELVAHPNANPAPDSPTPNRVANSKKG